MPTLLKIMITYKQIKAVQSILKVNCGQDVPYDEIALTYTSQDVSNLMKKYPADKFGYYALKEKVMAERSQDGKN